MAQQTPKQQYEASLQAILQIVMEMPHLTDGDWHSISTHTSTLWDLRTRLDAVQQQVIVIQENRYYRERIQRTPTTLMLTAQEKATDEDYTHCEWCKRIVKKSYMKTHQEEATVCLDIRLALEMEKRYLNSKVAWKRKIHTFFEKHRKTYQMMHYYIRKRLNDLQKPDGKGVFDYYNTGNPFV